MHWNLVLQRLAAQEAPAQVLQYYSSLKALCPKPIVIHHPYLPAACVPSFFFVCVLLRVLKWGFDLTCTALRLRLGSHPHARAPSSVSAQEWQQFRFQPNTHTFCILINALHHYAQRRQTHATRLVPPPATLSARLLKRFVVDKEQAASAAASASASSSSSSSYGSDAAAEPVETASGGVLPASALHGAARAAADDAQAVFEQIWKLYEEMDKVYGLLRLARSGAALKSSATPPTRSSEDYEPVLCAVMHAACALLDPSARQKAVERVWREVARIEREAQRVWKRYHLPRSARASASAPASASAAAQSSGGAHAVPPLPALHRGVYHTVLVAQADGGSRAGVEQCVQAMRARGLAPDQRTYALLMRAYAKFECRSVLCVVLCWDGL